MDIVAVQLLQPGTNVLQFWCTCHCIADNMANWPKFKKMCYDIPLIKSQHLLIWKTNEQKTTTSIRQTMLSINNWFFHGSKSLDLITSFYKLESRCDFIKTIVKVWSYFKSDMKKTLIWSIKSEKGCNKWILVNFSIVNIAFLCSIPKFSLVRENSTTL